MSNQFDTGYSLVPGSDPVSVDDRLASVLSDVDVINDVDPTIPYGRGWDFDFAAGEFRMHGQSPARLSGLQHLQVWIEKTLLTARYAHIIYSDEHGVEEPAEIIGQQITPGLIGRYQEHVKDALKVHDRISDVKDFVFDYDPLAPQLYVQFTVVTDTGDSITINATPGGL